MTEETVSEQYDHHRGSDPLLRPLSRRRVALVLTADFVGFVAACSFLWQYLSTGYWLDVSAEGYHAGMYMPLSEMFVQPLSIFAHPWMIPVYSVLLAVIFFVPIVVAVMYHELVALAFVLVVAAVGRAPALALLQAVGCVLAARTRLRSDGPFLAALLGMAPLLAYLGVFALTVGESARLPLQRWVLYSVVMVAMFLAPLAAAGVLGLAKLFRYRPGALCPVMAVMLAAAATVFLVRVGSDELAYALLVAKIPRPGKPDALFEPVSLDKWQETYDAHGLGREELKERIKQEVDHRRSDLIERCDRFLADYADSDRVPGVLWIKAQVQSLSLDESAYAAAYRASAPGDSGNGQVVRAVLITCSAEFVLPGSRETWQKLLKYRRSPHAALAAWRLGQLALRDQDVQAADNLLNLARERLEALRTNGANASDSRRSGRVFAPVLSVPYGNVSYFRQAARDVKRLLWMMRENHILSDPPSARALGEYLGVSRRAVDRLRRLAALAGKYEQTHMGDNLKLAVALMATSSFEKAVSLIELAQDNLTDAGIEANYQLGCLTMTTGSSPALPLVDKLKKPQEYFNAVANVRDNPWRTSAQDRLDQLAAQAKPPE